MISKHFKIKIECVIINIARVASKYLALMLHRFSIRHFPNVLDHQVAADEKACERATKSYSEMSISKFYYFYKALIMIFKMIKINTKFDRKSPLW